MQNCICLRLWNDSRHPEVLFTQLESILLFANLNENTDIILYVASSYKDTVLQNNLVTNKIIIEVYDDSKVSFDKLLLNLFDLPILKNYSKVLYLDIYTLIYSDVNKLFEQAIEDVLYTNGENNPKSNVSPAFYLFNNTEKIAKFFDNVQRDMRKLTTAIDYNIIPSLAKKANLYNNSLNSLVGVNVPRGTKDKLIVHFPENPQRFSVKPVLLYEFYDMAREFHIRPYIERALQKFNSELGSELNKEVVGNDIVVDKNGNCSYNPRLGHHFKQICGIFLNKHIENALIIGIDSGVIPFIISESNPDCKVTCVYNDSIEYNKIYVEKMCSLNMVTDIESVTDKYDVIYIDNIDNLDMILSHIKNLSKDNTVVCVSNYDNTDVKTKYDEFVVSNSMSKVQNCVYSVAQLSCMKF